MKHLFDKCLNSGANSGGVCMSAVILPYVQKWIRRSDVEETKILKQVIGACSQTVIDMIEKEECRFQVLWSWVLKKTLNIY